MIKRVGANLITLTECYHFLMYPISFISTVLKIQLSSFLHRNKSTWVLQTFDMHLHVKSD